MVFLKVSNSNNFFNEILEFLMIYLFNGFFWKIISGYYSVL